MSNSLNELSSELKIKLDQMDPFKVDNHQLPKMIKVAPVLIRQTVTNQTADFKLASAIQITTAISH